MLGEFHGNNLSRVFAAMLLLSDAFPLAALECHDVPGGIQEPRG